MKKAIQVLRQQVNWENLYFYQKTVVLYQMTVVFCRRFLPTYGDRTVDQMFRPLEVASRISLRALPMV